MFDAIAQLHPVAQVALIMVGGIGAIILAGLFLMKM